MSLRLYLNGSPASLESMGWLVTYGCYRIGLDGMAVSSYTDMPDKNQAPTLVQAGCSQDTCSHLVDLPIGPMTLMPLEGLRLELWPAKLIDGKVGEVEPARPSNRSDWSFSNLDSALGCGDRIYSGGASRAT
ncbi:MAG: hypothetical protein AAB214_07415, partial [Fibrobacterota bacterium]